MEEEITLEIIAEYEGTECAEYAELLIALNQTSVMTDEFQVALSKEIKEQLDWWKEFYIFVEKEEIIPERTRKIKELIERQDWEYEQHNPV